MRYAERDLTVDQPGGPGCAMREWPLELETVQSRGGTLMDVPKMQNFAPDGAEIIEKAQSGQRGTFIP